MFDATQYLGTRMGLFEKYADSVRLDHPDVADVRKTTYAKGVITDFKKIEDDPIQVEPMVKVTGDWGEESDYIPILFRPKAEYWDDPEGEKAIDFDTTKGVYAGSWQSFRADDEVVVLLQDGVPVAVLGFADGLPRIGEDIVFFGGATYWDEPTPYWISMLNQLKSEIVDEAELGPDGMTVGLELEVEAYEGDVDHQIDKLTYGGWPGGVPTAISDACYAEGGNDHSNPEAHG
jgi:hypothetical protein